MQWNPYAMPVRRPTTKPPRASKQAGKAKQGETKQASMLILSVMMDFPTSEQSSKPMTEPTIILINTQQEIEPFSSPKTQCIDARGICP